MAKSPVAIIILDGFGWRPEVEGNAVAQAKKPNFDRYYNEFPHTTLKASGLDVGLPDGQMGNSEVGHTNIGAGRIVYQSLTRIDKAILDGEFESNPALNGAFNHVKENGSALHLFGLLSDGGVHSHINHLLALVETAKTKGIDKVYIHAFMDGRDVDPKAGPSYIKTLEDKLAEVGVGEIATVSGRYYAMDRDKRWERVKLAYDAIAHSEGPQFESAQAVIEDSYAKDVTDEFVIPSVIVKDGKPVAKVEDNDAIIFFNFRPDRAIQLSNAFTDKEWTNFDRGARATNVKFVTMTLYNPSVDAEVAFPPIPMTNVLGEVLSKAGLAQLRIAVTDSSGVIEFDPVEKPGVSNLLTIFSAFSGESIESLVSRFKGVGYGQFKEELADAIIAVMEPIQERYYELLKSDKLDEILDEGAKKANYVANKTLRKMEKAVGLVR